MMMKPVAAVESLEGDAPLMATVAIAIAKNSLNQ